jgi:hypothetical protein
LGVSLLLISRAGELLALVSSNEGPFKKKKKCRLAAIQLHLSLFLFSLSPFIKLVPKQSLFGETVLLFLHFFWPD